MPPIATLHAAQDLIEHLSDYSGGEVMDRKSRDYRRAAVRAYQDLALSNEWKAYMTRGRINLNVAQDDGTIDFDLTGGTYERMVTLTGYTWPTWAEFGTLLIDGVRYKVDERKSNTQLTLTYDSCPTADVAALTTYTLYQNVYPLPEDFRKLDDAHYEQGLGCMKALTDMSDWLHLDQQQAESGRPYWYYIGGSPDTWQYGKMCLYVHPYPDTAESFDFTYWRNPRALYYTGQETEASVGTVSVSIDTVAVTGVSTTFSQKMVGALIRFSRDSTNLPEGEGGQYPYQEQRVIISVTNATTLTLNEAVDFAYSGVKYVITDPVDADGALLEALYRNAERMLDNFRHPERASNRERLYQQAWVQACERDRRLVPNFGMYGTMWQFGGGTLITSSSDDDDDDADAGGAAVPELLFSQTSIETVHTTTAETALSGTGDGSLTLAVNSWLAGDVIRVRASGTYGTKSTTAGTLTLRLKFGSTVMNSFSLTMPDAQTTKAWFLDASMTRHSIGPTGTVSGVGIWQYAVTGMAALQGLDDPVSNEALASDSTQTVSLTAEWGTPNVSNTITCSQLTVEQQGAE